MSAGGHFMFGQNGDGNSDLRSHEQLLNGAGVHNPSSIVSGNMTGSHANVNKKYSNNSSTGSATNLTINNNAHYPQGQSNNTTTPLYKRNNAPSHNVSVLSSSNQQQQPQQAAMSASYTSLSPSSSSVQLSPQNQSYSTVTSSQSTAKTPSAPVTTTPRLHSEFMSAANTAIRIKAACNGNVYISSVDSNFSLDEFVDHIQTICNIDASHATSAANTSSSAHPNGRFPAGVNTTASSSAASPMPISHSQQSSTLSNSFANDSAFSLSSVDCSPETSGCTIKWIDEDGDPCTIESEYELQEAMRQFYVNKEHEIRLYVFPGKPSRPGEPCEGEAKDIYRRGARRWRRLYKINGHSFAARRFGKRALCIICRDVIWGLGRQGFRCIQCKMMVHKKCHKRVAIACGESYEHVTRSLPTQKREEKPDMRKTSHHSDGKGAGSHSHALQSDVTSVQERCQEVPLRDDMPDSNLSLPHPSNSPTKVETAGRNSLLPASPNQMFSISMRDFNLLKVIGRGSFAKVLLAEYKRTGKRYAMKVIKKESIHDDEDIDCVQTEKNVFEIATNHPFLVGLHSCFQTPSRLIFVIEFVSGGDLMYHMQRQKKLPEEHGRFYAAEISSALHFLHDRGIIYRDLKLDNVLLDNEGHIKLTDYGMCKEKMGYYDTTGTFCGTPNYIAPELLTGAEYGFSVDWWALGVLTYEMLAGRSPFDLLNVDNVQNTEEYLFQIILEKPIRIPRSLSPKASAVLKGFLNKNPDDRLGCDPVSGYSQIQNHPFFRAVDWEALERKQIEPPFKPTIEDDHDLNNFDPQFTDEPVEFTPENPGILDAIDQTEFEGFEYVNPLLMSSEDNV